MMSKQKYLFVVAIMMLIQPVFLSAQWLETTITVGDSPGALVYNPTNNKVYCANYGSGNVTVIDGVTNSVITTITVGDSPGALVYNPTNNKIYSANAGSGNVTVIDGVIDSVITTITAGSWPRAFAWNSIQNRTYVANYSGSSVSVIRDVIGIEEGQKYNVTHLILNISPNPAKTFFTIFSSAPMQGIRIYDVLGKLVRTEDMIEFKNERTILLKQMDAGIYFLEIYNQDAEFIRKLLVTK